MTMTIQGRQPVGDLLREWRERRRLSQLALALDADVSTRHLSFLETGRAQPSQEMVLRLAEHLEVPLRERNTLLLAAGFAPAYPERSLDDPSLAVTRSVIDRVLAGHEPNPALAIDRHWTLIAANRAVPPLLAGVAPALLQPPVNVLRLSLHPDGLAPRIVNLGAWRQHLLPRIEREAKLRADAILSDLLDELRAYPVREEAPTLDGETSGQSFHPDGGVIPLRLRVEDGILNFISTTVVFGTPVDVAVSEVAIEAFFPADAPTETVLGQMLAGATGGPGDAGTGVQQTDQTEVEPERRNP